MLAGSQAILISFNKLLDPTSVVRESEYARSATGQSALETMKGYADKLARGGAGVTEAELRSYVRFGKEVVQKAMASTVGPERKRIERLVKFSGVDPALIFSGRFAPEALQAQGLATGGGASSWPRRHHPHRRRRPLAQGSQRWLRLSQARDQHEPQHEPQRTQRQAWLRRPLTHSNASASRTMPPFQPDALKRQVARIG